MGTFFVSHSSKDNAAAAELRARLAAWKYESVFLDFDPEHGIPAGRDWERELYRKLMQARALIVVWSAHWAASRWCFAELTQARMLGMHVFPVQVAPHPPDGILSAHQLVDVVTDPEEGYARLKAGLEAVGLHARDDFDWDEGRPPYPGLASFEEADAAFYFGRGPEIDQVMDTLARMRRQRDRKLAAIFGGSGSGKSSLVRAGVVPRLRKDPKRWIVLPPFRPGERPIDELARALVARCPPPSTPDWKDVRDRLAATRGPHALAELAHDLAIRGGAPDAVVLVVVDQGEELFTRSEANHGAAFLALLRAAFDAGGSNLLVLLAMRAEFVGLLQNHAALTGVALEALPLGLMPVERLPEVIEGPARRVGFVFDAGLVARMAADTSTDDALPLLAFTLRQMYERCRTTGRFTVACYERDLGGIQGAVARAADAVATGLRLTDAQWTAVRSAFNQLVTITDEQHYGRRAAPWSAVEPAGREIEAFIDARLLVSSGTGPERTVEVVHESLFRVWRTLADWLALDREFLLWRKRLAVAVAEWDHPGPARGPLLHGPRLAEAQRWLDTRGADALTAGEQRFIAASARRQRRRVGLAVLGVVGVLAAAVAVAITMQRSAAHARAQTRLATQRLYGATIARIQQSWEGSDTVRVTALLEGLRPADGMEDLRGFEWGHFWRLSHREERTLRQKGGPVAGAAFASDGRTLAVGTYGGAIAVWSTVEGEEPAILSGHTEAVIALAFSPDRRLLVSGSDDHRAKVWEVSAGRERLTLEGHPARVYAVAFAPDGKTVATGSTDGTRLWDPTDGRARAVLPLDATGMVTSLAFSGSGEILAVATNCGVLQVWRLADTARPIAQVRTRESTFPGFDEKVAVAEDGATVWVAQQDGTVGILRPSTPAALERIGFAVPPLPVSRVALSRDGTRLAAGYADSSIRVWDVANAAPLDTFKGHAETVDALAFSFDGTILASGGFVPHARGSMMAEIGETKLWRVGQPTEPVVVAQDDDVFRELHSLAFSRDGRIVATAETDGVHLRDVDTGRVVGTLEGSARARGLDFSHDGTRIAAGTRGGVLVWSVASRQVIARLADPTPSRSTLTTLSFAPNDATLVTGSWDDAARIWDLRTNTLVATLRSPPVSSGAPTAGADAPPEADARDDSPDDAVDAAAISPDGRLLVAGTTSGTLTFWDLPAGTLRSRFSGHPDWVSAVAFAPDGRSVASGSFDGTVKLVDVASAAEIATLAGHRDRVYAVAYAPDGRTIASAGADGVVKLWSATTAQELATLRFQDARPDTVVALAFAPDGRVLAAGTRSATLALWHADPP